MVCVEPSEEEIETWLKKLEKLGLDPVMYIQLNISVVKTVLSCRNFGSCKCRFNIIKNPRACENCPFLEYL